jgi:hypothetical protein
MNGIRRTALGGLVAAGLALAACASEDAAAIGQAPADQAPSTVKFHVEIGGGPFKGTYDLVSDACLANALGPNSWNATFDAYETVKGRPDAVMVTSHPTSRVADAKTMGAVFFGGDAAKVVYEMKPATVTVTDRGTSATIVAKGPARTTSYVDGSFGDGGTVTITVECDKVERH